MKCLYLTQEYAPLFAEGGLGLTAAALTRVLDHSYGTRHDLVLPYYPHLVERGGLRTEKVHTLPALRAEVHRLSEGAAHGDVYLVRADRWYDRPGIYRDADYRPFSDETARAAFFGRCVATWLAAQQPAYDLVHGNDWQSGAAMAHIRRLLPGLPQMLTVHNGLYRGEWPGDAADLVLPLEEGPFESLLLTACRSADAVVTCSPGYAGELLEQTRDTALGAALRRAGLSGIVFGIDDMLWNPTVSGRVTSPFDVSCVDRGKRVNKGEAQKRLALREDDSVPLIGVCSRLVHEKGSDLLLTALRPLLRRGTVQLALMGPADGELRGTLAELSAEGGTNLAYLPAFDQEAAWLLYAGADLTVMPSRVEPCGLNQLIAYRYGTLPVVSPVGGLRDTVTDLRTDPGTGTGFLVPAHTAEAVRDTVVEALDWLASDPGRTGEVRRRVMLQDWSWRRAAGEYARLYTRLAGQERTR